jgi:hypothetical protein
MSSIDFLRSGSQEVWILDEVNRIVLIHTETGVQVLQRDGFAVSVSDLLS